MSNEYAVNKADLTSVADAIRTKGETSDQLVFPDGFVTAIEAIKGGGDLNFEVVGGTTQPTNPAENTIWVNTDQEITGWAFSAEEPESPNTGMVWFPTEQKGTTFNALTENVIAVSPLAASQYIDGTWYMMDTEIFINGAWTDLWTGDLFYGGSTFDEITGGWSPCALGGYSLDMGQSYITDVMRVWKYTSTPTSAAYATNNKIDLSGYSYIEVLVDQVLDSPHIKVMITPSLSGDPYSNAVAMVTLGSEGKFTLPIPDDLTSMEQYIIAGEYSSAGGKYGADISRIRLRR